MFLQTVFPPDGEGAPPAREREGEGDRGLEVPGGPGGPRQDLGEDQEGWNLPALAPHHLGTVGHTEEL